MNAIRRLFELINSPGRRGIAVVGSVAAVALVAGLAIGAPFGGGSDDDSAATSPALPGVATTTATHTSGEEPAPGAPVVSAPTATVPPTIAPATAAPSTTAAPDELEPEPGPGAGDVIQLGAVGARPVHEVDEPTWTVVDLDPLEAAIPPALSTEPAPFDVPPADQGIGQLVSNAPGCASNCIVHALIHASNFTPDVVFDLETNVATGSGIWLLDEAPFSINGVPQVTGWPSYLGPGYVKQWTPTLELEYETTYHVVVKVTDQYGNATWLQTEYTSVDDPGLGGLVANGDGCYFQCITLGKVEFTDSYDTVVLVIGTNVGATEDIDFDVQISSQEPGYIGGKPFLPHDHPFVVDQDGGNDIRGHVSGLAGSTTYHVVVKAIDEDGFISHVTGSFTTDPIPRVSPTDVRIGWERIYVQYDGDPGGWGKGELAFAWGFIDDRWIHAPGVWYGLGARNEEKIGDGTSIDLGCCNHHWVSLWDGDVISPITVTGHENDTHGNHEPDSCKDLRQLVYSASVYVSGCSSRVNVARTAELDLDTIREFPLCSEYGLTGDKAEAHCLVLKSMDANENHVQFDALVSFLIAD